MSRIFYTSDQHYGHAGIILHCNRPFRDVDEMTEGLIQRHNAKVAVEDVVYHVGDFAWKEALIAPILERLHGSHFLIMGNHDRCHPVHSKSKGALERYLSHGFRGVEERVTLFMGRHEVLLCHVPYHEDDARHSQSYDRFRPIDDGKTFLLHGHSHNPPQKRVRCRMIDVGVDAWGWAPVAEREILAILDGAGQTVPIEELW